MITLIIALILQSWQTEPCNIPTIESLPIEIRDHIVEYLTYQDTLTFCSCSHSLRSSLPLALFKHGTTIDLTKIDPNPQHLHIMCAKDGILQKVPGIKLSLDQVTQPWCLPILPKTVKRLCIVGHEKMKRSHIYFLPLFLKLTHVTFVNCHLLNDDMKVVNQLTDLIELNLSRNYLSRMGIIHLEALKNLQHLDISFNQIMDFDLKHVLKFRKLSVLALSHNRLTCDGIKQLSSMVTLKHLNLARNAIHNEGLEHLSKLENLERLDLSRNHITDEGLRYLSPLKQLHTLNLSHNIITDKGIAYLDALPHLHTLYLYGISIGERSLTKLSLLVHW